MAPRTRAAARRASTWSSRPLFDQFPAVLVVEIMSHHDARSLAKAAPICRDFAGSVAHAISARVARCGGSLRLPRPVAGESATKRLRFAERVGPTGLEWEICEVSRDMMQKVKRLTCVPHFDRLVPRARDDRLSVRSEGHGGDSVAVGALLARLELQST